MFFTLVSLALQANKKDEKLLNAITDGDISLVKEAIAEGADIHTVDWLGKKDGPLKRAASSGQFDPAQGEHIVRFST